MNMGTGLQVSLKRKCKPVSKVIAQEGEGPACDNVCPYSRKFRILGPPLFLAKWYAGMMIMMMLIMLMIFESRRRRRYGFPVIVQSNCNLDGGNYFDGDIYCVDVVSVFD